MSSNHYFENFRKLPIKGSKIKILKMIDTDTLPNYLKTVTKYFYNTNKLKKNQEVVWLKKS